MENENDQSESNVVVQTSLFDRLTGVFVSPGEVFEQLRHAPPAASNWWVPLLLSLIAVIAYICVAFSQPAVLQQTRDQQAQVLKAKVDKGAMTQQQADAAMEAIERFSTPAIMKISGSVAGVFAMVAMFFLINLGVWLLGSKVFHGGYDFMKSAEMLGLTQMISVVGTLILIPLVIAKGNLLVNLGPVLLLDQIDPKIITHQILLSLNLFNVWYVVVLGLGIARLSGASIYKALGVLIGIWFLIRLVAILSGATGSGY